MDQAGKSFGLLKKVSSLESQMSVLMVKVVELKECDAFMTKIIESACEQLQCKLLGAPECFLLLLLVRYILTSCFPGVFLDLVAENRRVSERVATLERVSSDTNTFWVDACCHGAIVLLQDRVHHIGESVDDCQKSLTTMFSVMLPRNPPPESFGQLLKVFRSSQRIHRLIELSLVVGANFALGWVRKWHPKLNLNTMSLGLPPPQRSRSVALQVHMDDTFQPARRMIAKLLETDADFFREYHYLNPLLVDL
jgi:hypothetical protein